MILNCLLLLLLSYIELLRAVAPSCGVETGCDLRAAYACSLVLLQVSVTEDETLRLWIFFGFEHVSPE